jgi:hypothetical protein
MDAENAADWDVYSRFSDALGGAGRWPVRLGASCAAPIVHSRYMAWKAGFAALLLIIGNGSAATGEVSLTGAIISNRTLAGYEPAKAFDGDYSTAWRYSDNTVGGGWVGIDAGRPVIITRLRLAPPQGIQGAVFSLRWPANKVVIEGANSADFSGAVPIYAIPDYNTGVPAFYPSQMLEIRLSHGSTRVAAVKAQRHSGYRYFRLRDPGAFPGGVAEMRFIVEAEPGLSAAPVPPVITPGSGAFLNGTAVVTLTSATSSAQLHYTADGSDPTCGSTPYSGPFSLAVSGNVVLKAVACDDTVSTPQSEISSQQYRNYGWHTGDMEYDDTGRQVVAVQSGITWAEGKYWRVGGNRFWPMSGEGFFLGQYDWWMYSSPDLYSWSLAGPITPNHGWSHLERAHIVYNSATSKYVLWGNVTNNYDANSRAMILTADHPQGPWSLVDSAYNPGGLGFKDNSIFVDDDGTGYAVFTTGTQNDMAIMKMNASYTGVTGDPVYASRGQGREAPALFRRGGTYFLITSPTTRPSAGHSAITYQTASSPLDAWSSPVPLNDRAGVQFDAQVSQVFPVHGKQDAWMLLADQWGYRPVGNPPAWWDSSGTQNWWYPLSFPTATTLRVERLSSWDLSYFPETGSVPAAAR